MRFLYIFASTLLLITACGKNSARIQNGDHLFLYATDDSLSQAINTVTESEPGRNYTHQGLVQIEGKDTFVWHSAPEKGVVKESLSEFQNTQDGALRGMDIFRMPDSLQKHLPTIWKRANVLLGKPYNATYIMEDDGFYCSEFIYALFSTYGLFTLEPMNFKDPKTGTYPKAWIDHYQKLDIQIPEGKPGCNPNGMSRSPMLQKVN